MVMGVSTEGRCPRRVLFCVVLRKVCAILEVCFASFRSYLICTGKRRHEECSTCVNLVAAVSGLEVDEAFALLC